MVVEDGRGKRNVQALLGQVGLWRCRRLVLSFLSCSRILRSLRSPKVENRGFLRVQLEVDRLRFGLLGQRRSFTERADKGLRGVAVVALALCLAIAGPPVLAILAPLPLPFPEPLWVLPTGHELA